jgi:hypothetical protein
MTTVHCIREELRDVDPAGICGVSGRIGLEALGDDVEEDVLLPQGGSIEDPPQRGEALLSIQHDLWDEIGTHPTAKLGGHVPHLDLVGGVPEQDRARRESAVDRVEKLGDLGMFQT